MKSNNLFFGIILSSFLYGCISLPGPGYYKKSYYSGEQAILFKQASFDLNCPISVLKDEPLSINYMDIGVTGCGNRAKYKYVQSVGWVANTVTKQK